MSANIEAYTAWDGRVRKWRYAEAERPPGTYCACYDCDRPYSSIGDCVVPDDVWAQITPATHRAGGLLCANCIIERLHVLGISDVTAALW